jgi:YD repeat-containing protein
VSDGVCGEVVSFHAVSAAGCRLQSHLLVFSPMARFRRLIAQPLTQLATATSINDLNASQTTYGYDAKNRLIQDVTSGTNAHTYNYSYDSNDNILTNSESGVVVTSTYDLANRLTTSISSCDGDELHVRCQTGTRRSSTTQAPSPA